MKKVLPIILGIILLLSAIGHLFYPEPYKAMIPDFIPETLANILATITETIVGVALLLPAYRRWGGLGFAALMIGFLPLHVWDVFRDTPAMGSMVAALIRLTFQFVLIYAGWWIYKAYRTT